MYRQKMKINGKNTGTYIETVSDHPNKASFLIAELYHQWSLSQPKFVLITWSCAKCRHAQCRRMDRDWFCGQNLPQTYPAWQNSHQRSGDDTSNATSAHPEPSHSSSPANPKASLTMILFTALTLMVGQQQGHQVCKKPATTIPKRIFGDQAQDCHCTSRVRTVRRTLRRVVNMLRVGLPLNKLQY